tara:strand:- start:1092 stop:1616 length:525 start_codon:yes stop_codon:yes gene_type:complete
MKTIITHGGLFRVTGNREQSSVNVTLDFWNAENDERVMEIFAKVNIVGEPKITKLFNPIMNPDSNKPSMLFSSTHDNLAAKEITFGKLSDFFSKKIVDKIEKDILKTAVMLNAPNNEMINFTNTKLHNEEVQDALDLVTEIEDNVLGGQNDVTLKRKIKELKDALKTIRVIDKF